MKSDKPQVLAVCSGKGGVGKTTLSVNLSIALSRLGLRVCLMDADTSLANINIMLRETPVYTLQDVLSGEKHLDEILLTTQGIGFVPSASGVTAFSELTAAQQQTLIMVMQQLEQRYEVILVDTSAGVHEAVMSFIEAAHQSLVVITPEPTSLTDAFSLLRMLHKRGYRKRINIVVNQADTELAARQVFRRFTTAVTKYIGYHAAYLGHVVSDELVSSAVCSQVPIRVYRPAAAASGCYDEVARHLHELLNNQKAEQSMSDCLNKQLNQAGDQHLGETEPSPVLAQGGVAKKPPVQHEAEGLEAQRVIYQQADRTRKKQLMQEHKFALLEYVEDADQSREDITRTLQQLINAYFRRFKDYPVNPVALLEQMLMSHALRQQDINQLFTQLMLFYKEKRIQLDRDTAAEIINQQISDYVHEYGHYPFDVSKALLQSTGFGQLSDEAIEELNSMLSRTSGTTSALAEVQHGASVTASVRTEKEPLENPRTRQKGLKDGIRFASRLSK